jgi:uncharacterized protein
MSDTREGIPGMIGKVPAGMALQHLLVFFLIVVTPLWDRYEIPRLKASTEPRKKIRFYGKIVTASWMCALVAGLTIGLAVFTIQRAPGEIAWLDAGSRGAIFLKGMIGGVLAVIFVPALLAVWSEKLRQKAGKAAKKLAYLLPSTHEERLWWWMVCITAGVCEEVVYRGFLLHYFHTTPLHLSLTLALVVSSVIFGIGHLYQGIAGAVQTAVIGFLLGVMYLMTGNLLLPVLVHAMMDLRVLAMLPEGFEAAG